MSKNIHRRRTTRSAIFAVASLVLGVTAACGTSSTPTSGGGGASQADLTYVQQQINKYKAVPTFSAPGPAFDASKARGKSLFAIPATSTIPFLQSVEDNLSNVAGQQGVKFTEWKNEGQPSQYVQGMETAVNQGANSIDLMGGITPGLVTPQIAAAKAKDIPTVVSHTLDPSQNSVINGTGTAAIVPFGYKQAGVLLGDWVILQTGGKTHTIVLTIDESLSTAPMVAGIEGEFSQHCGPTCKLTKLNFGITDATAKIQPVLQTALVANPDVNYVIALFDSFEGPYAVAAIRAAGKVGNVKIATYNGTPSILQQIQEDGSIITMDVGESVKWDGYGILDQHMRLMTGTLPLASENLPLRVWDKSNVSEAGTPPNFDSGYGTDFVAGYKKLWGG